MRYIGSKERLLGFIDAAFEKHGVSGSGLLDAFAGTARVGAHFRKKGWRVVSCDLMYYSHTLARTMIACERTLDFSGLPCGRQDNPLEKAVSLLNALPPRKGFIWKNYSPEGGRMYYTAENAMKLDAARLAIEEWRAGGLLTDGEYFALIASVIETAPFYANVNGVFAAYRKMWDKRALKPLRFRVPEIPDGPKGQAFCGDTVDFLDKIDADVLYLDPPYNQRQYAPNYHILETLAAYDDPEIQGISGMRNYSAQKSLFCGAKTALPELRRYLESPRWKWLVLSYNSEGLMPHEAIMDAMSAHGAAFVEEREYPRFKSHASSAKGEAVKERLYIVKRK